MKRIWIVCAVIFAATAPVLKAQHSLSGMSFNGSTGLYSIPSGRTGWEDSSSFAIDLGYHAIITEGKATHIPKMSFSLFRWVELSAAMDFQPKEHNQNQTDFIGGLKLQLPISRTSLALGGNIQALNFSNKNINYIAGQVYIAVTFAGQFFDMPAETTVVLGKTFIEDQSDSNVDFGMGFELVLFPSVFEGFVRWITDFANFSYSVEPFSANAWYRGVLNTGIRLDLSAIPPLSRFKFNVDVLMTDAFDDTRAFSAGVVFGIPIF